MNNKRRVVITGLGVIAANGIGVHKFFEAIKAGKSGVNKITSFDTAQYPVKIAAEVKNFNPQDYLDEKALRVSAKFTQFALVAAKEAMRDAGLNPKNYSSDKIGVAIGTSTGGLDFNLAQHAVFLKEGPLFMDTFVTSIASPSAATRAISLEYQAKGVCATLTSSCVAASDAIGYGFDKIREGETEIMITGGTEAPIAPAICMGFYLGRVLSSYNNEVPINVPRPFDLKRTGTVIGEGAAILILEELKHALKRGAHIYAEIAGYGATCDSYHVVIPDPEGREGIRAIELALEDAKIKPQGIDYINAHGTATLKNDEVETLIIKKVFKKAAYKIPVSATKPLTGHLLGATGAIEALICILSIKNNLIPPTINYEFPDPNCDLDYVPLKARKQEIHTALSNSFGFGGFNVALVFKKYNPCPG